MMHEAKGIVQDRLSRGLVGNNSGSTSGNHLSSRQRERSDGTTAMKVAAQFCPVDQDPFDTVSWDKRTAQIKDEAGDVLFEQTDCEIPESWSALATNVVVSKYFYGEPGTPEREHERSAADPPRRPHDRRLGHRRRLFRHAAKTARTSTATSPGCASINTARSTRPFGSMSACTTSTASRARAGTTTGTRRPGKIHRPDDSLRVSASVGLLHPVGRRQHGRHHAPGDQRGHAVQVRLGHRHRPVDHPQLARKALRRRHPVRPALLHAGLRPDRRGREVGRQDPSRGQDAEPQGLASRHPRIHPGESAKRRKRPAR